MTQQSTAGGVTPAATLHRRSRAPALLHRAFASLLIIALVGCKMQRADVAAADSARPPPQTPATGMVDPRWPISISDFPTTSEAIYLGNLDSIISEYGRVLGENPSAGLRTALAGVLYHRFKIVGRIGDAERAIELLDEAVREEPAEPAHRLMRATAYSAFHRFTEAEADLAVAAKSTDAGEIAKAQREIDLALGRYDRLAPEFAPTRPPTQDFYELVHRADLALMQGDPDEANFQFRSAQIEYRDVNPVPLAWLHVQRGIGSLRFGDVQGALPFFASAHARMPRYYLATEHLAEVQTLLGDYDGARKLYLDVIRETGNPEFIAALAALETAAGKPEAAAARNAEAKSGYAALYARHPDAYAQHYAEFLLNIAEPVQALELAERNVKLRQDVGSWILLARAAEANKNYARACDAHRAAVATGRKPPELTKLSALAERCARPR